ncbi:MAG: chitobiase/beta-hexosaminidase C-terminal domain-containing protein [Candidatus Cloacimonetes bacterium]|nr:chitobiase/beta-hexosaminidase C-terminal domain-containing protein [Candidatus Cloacimonadota bacterium]
MRLLRYLILPYAMLLMLWMSLSVLQGQALFLMDESLVTHPQIDSTVDRDAISVRFEPLAGYCYLNTQIRILTTPAIVDSIKYTTDGSDPSNTNGLVYNDTIRVQVIEEALNAQDVFLLKARAYGMGIESNVYTSQYTVHRVTTPVFNPPQGLYYEPQTLSITCDTPGAQIRYRINQGLEQIYSYPIQLLQSCTISAKATKDNYLESHGQNAEYLITGTVSAPEFSPDAFMIAQGSFVFLSCVPDDADIWYTFDGSEPSVNGGTSSLYDNGTGIPINGETGSIIGIKAKAFKTDWIPSPTTEKYYLIDGDIEPPSFSPSLDSVYTAPLHISITSSTPGSQVYYNINSDESPDQNSELYSEAVYIDSTSMIKAKAYHPLLGSSDVSIANYYITGTVATPNIEPQGGVYPMAQEIGIECATPGATIRYTLDGSIPENDEDGFEYEDDRFTLPENSYTVVTARAFKDSWIPSSVAVEAYQITGTVADPSFFPESGTVFTSADYVTIHCPTVGAEIYYTVNETYTEDEPTTDDLKYQGPIHITHDCLINAKAFLDLWNPSSTVRADYIVTGTLPKPYFDPPQGLYYEPTDVMILCSDVDTTIYYRVNEADTTKYQDPITVTDSLTVITAWAAKAFWANSAEVSAQYRITGTVSTPEFKPSQGVFTEPTNVKISCDTYGAMIRYTTDGSEPTLKSLAYTAPLELCTGSNVTIKARAYREDWIESPVASGEYIVTGKVESPTFDPSAGLYYDPVLVSMHCATNDAKIRYTLDGSDPTPDSDKYESPLELNYDSGSVTIKAKALLDNWIDSDVTSVEYTVTGILEVPIFSEDEGTYLNQLDLSLEAVEEATIMYSINSGEYVQYVEQLSLLPGTYTIKAYAKKQHWLPSPEIQNTYHIMAYEDSIALNHTWTFGGKEEDDYLLVGLPGEQWTPIKNLMQGKPFVDWSVYANAQGQDDETDLTPWTDTDEFDFRPGIGFWLLSRNKVVVNQQAVPNVTLNDELSYSITVRSGWNIISNPFDKLVLWRAVKERNCVNTDLFDFQNGVFMPSQLMLPFKAYYWYNQTDIDSLMIAIDDSPMLDKGDIFAKTVSCQVTELSSGKVSVVEMGISDHASDAMDPWDQPYPLLGFNSFAACIGDNNLYKDYRQGPNQSFAVNIHSENESEIELNFQIDGTYPGIVLMNDFDGSVYELRNGVSMVFPPHQKKFRVITGDNDYIQHHSSWEAPELIKLYQNAPNPFKKSTNIMVYTPEKASVTIQVYNIRGQLVRTLADSQSKAPGNKVWNFNAESLPSGVYYCRLTWVSDNQSGSETRKMLFVK